MIRFICIVIVLFLYLVIGIPVLLIENVVGLVSKRAKDYSCLRMVQWTFRLMLKIAGVSVTVIGEENIPDEPVLYIGNHRSYFDILLTYSRCRRLTGYVAKKEMLRYPLLRDWMKNLTVSPRQKHAEGGTQNHSDCYRIYQKWNFYLHLPGGNKKYRRRTFYAAI